MFARAFAGSARHARRYVASPSLPRLRSASLFTASIGLGTCPKRRRKQSNEESGEDAYFIQPQTAPDTRHVWAGVFDGVGGWADSGVDPSIFSHGLARHCDEAAGERPDASPAQVLVSGYNRLQDDPAIAMGSSTACVARIDLDSGTLSVANLGDSGYLILSLSGETSHASKAQTYFFNAPYQLAKMPDFMRSPNSLENGPQDADLTRHVLRPDQVVILATDGFFDNIFASDAASMLAKIAAEGVTKAELVRQLATVLRDAARTAGRSCKNGPFATEAKSLGLRYEGGKEDDVCLIVVALDHAPLKSKL